MILRRCTDTKKGLILHSGAIGDCLLTLPLAAYLKRACGLPHVHFMGRPEAVGFYPQRSCIDSIRPMESVPLHRLFEPEGQFVLDEHDRLITAFDGYEQIVSFLGADHPTFEHNLILTVHCSHSAEITMLPLAPSSNTPESVSYFYIRYFAEQNGLDLPTVDLSSSWLTPTAEDFLAGRDRLRQVGVNPDASVAILHPGSGGRHKCWHPENFVGLANALGARGLKPVFLFVPAEQERFSQSLQNQFQQTAPVLSNLNLAEVLEVLTQADLFVGNDSGISHLAGALGKKTLAIFGPTDSVLYHPLGPAVTIFQADPEGFQTPCQADLAGLLERLDNLP